ncbi:AmiS/UreI family transporter [Pseudonocardia spirodelae]|uniref:AmiS/UreI family transporter n=1 Tax=Pseudonocardia spirodelae TaxID=3133431 RepID=A0ABU8T3M0_9PSEU
MGSVGLLYVGAVLFVNGLMLLGLVEGRAAAPINLFVGALQVLTPTLLIVGADGDRAQILAASGLYLFGFTYLYVGIGQLARLDSTGVGWFSLFVAVAAVGYSWANFTIAGDAAFGVIWLYWAFLWGLFFVLLGLKRDRIARFTGWVTVVQAWVTAAIPAFTLLTVGALPGWSAVALAVFGVVVFGALALATIPRRPGTEPAPAAQHRTGRTGAPAA